VRPRFRHASKFSYVPSSLVAIATVLGLAACGSSAAALSNTAATKPLNIAYLSFAVDNSYDAPMLAAAQAVANGSHANVKVFDADNSPQKQHSQLQTAIASRRYDGIIVQPISGTGLISLVKEAIARRIKVVNMDQILGSNLSTDEPQVTGLSANVTFVPTKIGTQLGQLVVRACQSENLNPCNVGYLYDVKASALDVAISGAFDQAIAADPAVQVVTQGQSFFTPAIGQTAVRDMLQAHPKLSLIVGSDQGIEGAAQALAAADLTGKVILVGYGGSSAALAGITSGAWYGDVAQAPAREGTLAMQALIAALETGKASGAINPVAGLPAGGIITKANVGQFTAEWAG
jgi:ribose transport system substrate-binding protein